MKNHLATAALLALAVSFAPGLAKAGSFNQGGVRIFTPAKTTPPDDTEPTTKPETITRVIITKRVIYTRYRTRAERLKAMFGHRYTGFKKQYRGPKYPF